jgi:septal ring factor EnvC (AmiA/AmiB activator)
MMSPAHRTLLIALAVLILSGPWRTSGQQDASEYEKRLGKINEQLKELREKLGREEKRESTILSSLAKISFNKKILQSELDLYSVHLEKTGREISALKTKMDGITAKLEKEEDAVGATLLTLYKFGRFSFLQFAFQTENFETLIRENRNLSLIARYQDKSISEYRTALTELGRSGQQLDEKKKELSGLYSQAALKRKDLESEERKNQSLIREIQRNKKTYEQTISELKDSAEMLQELVKKLASDEFALPFPLIPLYEKKGSLAWPISGKVISLFGLQKHPHFSTITMNNGIEIAPARDKLIVSAIHPGKVVYAEHFQGYGNLLIIDHGLTYYSLYGHCAEFLAKKGDAVATGLPVAVAGDSGSLRGTTLYLEIRYKTKPLDPLQWLKRR